MLKQSSRENFFFKNIFEKSHFYQDKFKKRKE